MIDVDDLVEATEIARRFHVAGQSVVHDWRRRHDSFPEPIYSAARTRIWAWSDVEAWGRQTGRLTLPDGDGHTDSGQVP